MIVFDKGGFRERDKGKRRTSQSWTDHSEDWEEGFKSGYKAALDRYIELKE